MNILDFIGNTPLLELKNIGPEIPGVTILAKAEFLNPSGSVKDRAAKALIQNGIDTKNLNRDKTIVDATSGNSGIAYAMFGSALKFKVILFLPKNVSLERKQIIKSYGASIVETDPLESSDGAYLAAKEVAKKNSSFFFPDQYNNLANLQIQYQTTAVEIWKQTEGKITHFVSSMGTSGTFMGTAKRLKEYNPKIKTIAVQPDSPLHGIEGTKHMASTIIPGFYEPNLIDEQIIISTEEAYSLTRRLAKEIGILVGISSGANVAASLKLALKLPPGSKIVTILADSGHRYLSDSFWNK
jgi:cysteine synthase B